MALFNNTRSHREAMQQVEASNRNPNSKQEQANRKREAQRAVIKRKPK